MTQISHQLTVPTATQSAEAASTNTLQTSSTNSANYLMQAVADLVIGLESHAKATTSLSSASMLAATADAEPQASTGTLAVGQDALATLGDAVGAGMANAGTAIDWTAFAQQSQQTLSAAGYSATDIDTYLGAVMAGYAQASQAFNAATQLPSAVSTITTSLSTASSTSSFAVALGNLPNKSFDATQFTALGEKAYNAASASLGSNVDINLYVANTQQEMQAAGYAQDQINNYMTGLYTAYNASPAAQASSSSTS